MNLPPEIIYQIFLYVDNVKKYKILNSDIHSIINKIFKDYTNLFNNIYQYWKYNISRLIMELIKITSNYESNNLIQNSLNFLVHNYKTNDIYVKIAKYLKLSNNKKLIDIVLEGGYEDYNIIIQNAARMGYFDILINISKRFKSINYNLIAYEAAFGNHYNILEWAIENGAYEYDTIAFFAARGGNYNIFRKMVKLSPYPINYDKIARAAAESGNIKILEIAISEGLTNYNVISSLAAFYGNFNIIELLIDKPINYNDIAAFAAKNGHLSIVKFAIDNGARNYYSIATDAAGYGSLEIIEYVYKYEKFSTDLIASNAAEGGHLHVLYWALEHDANNFNNIVKKAALGGYFNIVLQYYNDSMDISQIALNAVISGNLNMVKWALEKGKVDCNEMIITAAKYNYLDIIKYLIGFCNYKNIGTFENIGIIAAKYGYLEIVKWAIENGAKNIRYISNEAYKYNNKYIMEWISNIST